MTSLLNPRLLLLQSFLMLSYVSLSQSPAVTDEGNGGPVLLVTSSSNPFSKFSIEILRSEGWNEYKSMDISQVTAAVLTQYDIVIIGDIAITVSQASLFTNWTNNGGTLIAFSPDPALSSLLGITAVGGIISDKYIRVDNSTAAGKGIVGQTIQFHGQADLYTANAGTTILATLYSDANTPTSYPAVTSRTAGSNGGEAIAFLYDLARSVVYTRQGNPAWAGQERDGTVPVRASDQFFGNASFDPKPDWIDLNKVDIPQADEQVRLLSNLMLIGNFDKKPLPRFWFLPKGKKAAIVMTGDDHGNNGTTGRFNAYKALGPNTMQAVENWDAIRGSSYIFPSTPITDAQIASFQNEGFEIGLHLNTGCLVFTSSSWNSMWDAQWNTLKTSFPSVSNAVSHRAHCIAWSNWAIEPKAQALKGIRLDVNYYYWPGSWINNRPGMFTGSGMPMRFADLDGTIIDCYQVVTQMTDESGQTYPFTVNALLDAALGAKGFYGVFCANMHTDYNPHDGSIAIVNSAIARQIPVVSAKQMLDWIDGRNNSSFTNITWTNKQLSFSIDADPKAKNIKAMLPRSNGTESLLTISRNGITVPYTTEIIKGIDYVFFDGTSGNYLADYGSSQVITPPPPPTVTTCAKDDLASEFALGNSGSGITIVSNTNGELSLKPALTEEQFNASTIPSGWNAGSWSPSGSTTFAGGVATLNGTNISSAASFLPGSTLEFSARYTLGNFENIGFAQNPLFDPYWIAIGRGGVGTAVPDLFVRTSDGVSISLGTNLLNAYHTYRISWKAAAFTIYVDGVLTATVNKSRSTPLIMIVSDYNADGIVLSVDWIRNGTAGYPASGTYTSRVFALSAAPASAIASWNTTVPAGTAANISVRAGNTPAPDASWTAFVPGNNNQSFSLNKTYLQYQAVLNTNNPALTPLFSDISFTCAAAPPPPTVTTCAKDDLASEFALGNSGSGITIVSNTNGELSLKPALTEEQFNASTIPSGWNAGSWSPSGSITFTGGVASLNGISISSAASFLPGSTLEFSARYTLGNFENIGFAQNALFDPYWIVIGRGGVGTTVSDLFVRTSDGVSISLGTNLLNAYHTYRISWQATAFTIYVDGVLKATVNKTRSAPLIMIASDYNADGIVLSVDWIRNGSAGYPASGTFSSRVFALSAAPASAIASWNATLPAGTAANISVRAGNTPAPDASWTAFIPMNNNQSFSLNKTYLQYQAVLNTSDPAITPLFSDISFTCAAPPSSISNLSGVKEFSPLSSIDNQPFTLEQNRPNPFNRTTFISYSIPRPAHVTIIIYDLQGRVVKIVENANRKAGRYTIETDNSRMAKGLYFYSLQAGEFTTTKKMILE